MADDVVSINITETITRTRLSPIQPERSICKVPNYLRKVDETAYEPLQLAIGPYHRGMFHLEAMEELKFRFLQKLLEEREEINDVSKYVKAMRELETKALNCYADPANLESDGFFKVDGLCFSLRRDLLLLENQIPFFVVLELLGIIGISDKKDFTRKILGFLEFTLPDLRLLKVGVKSIGEIRHLLDLIHEYWRPSPVEIEARRNIEETDTRLTRCATELKEAGIKFKKVKGESLFDIKFEKGTLKIPTLNIDDDTNYLLRNLIALEQLFPAEIYVETLTHYGIVDNLLGDNEAAATMFNRLGDSINYSSLTYSYREVPDKVNAYCRRRRNKWLANLNHNYFNSPWALISVLAATVILLLTLMQTIFSGIALST
ncbi:UPF0481 protein At3g47200-like [Durio zibethinus]|uniref:UPF0481 protein At3g47200-like n=1 Tax=Durio zibethinus TaxID=66656 RepID=A0A6P5X3H6_DURZI|nr:UPF0481 protein At3g47200-like [Durio zibethinus]